MSETQAETDKTQSSSGMIEESKQVEPPRSTVVLPVSEIETKLKNGETYNENGINIKYDIEKKEDLEKLEDRNKYVAKIQHTDFNFVGTLNKEFMRSAIGRNQFRNGDVYFGNWEDDLRNSYGIYYHSTKENTEIFHGFHEKGKRAKGIYVWIDGPIDVKKQTNPDEVTFQFFLGKFADGEISEGLWMSQAPKERNLNIHCYFGKFKDGKKFDENAYYEIPNSKKGFYGTIHDNELIKGHVVNLVDDGNKYGTILDYEKGRNPETKEVYEAKRKEITEKYDIFYNVTCHDFRKYIYNDVIECLKIKDHYKSIDDVQNRDLFDKDFSTLIKYGDQLKILKPLLEHK